jgi:thioredoxin 1
MKLAATRTLALFVVTLLSSWAWCATESLDAKYPGLCSGALAHAELADLPEGTLLTCGAMKVSKQAVEAEIAKSPEKVRAQLKKSALFLLERTATRRLLLSVTKSDGKAGADENAAIGAYLEGTVAKVAATEAEAKDFFKKNPTYFSGAPFSKVRKPILDYLTKQKRQTAVAEHIRTLGKRMPIKVSASWVKEQAPLMRDNAVDRVRLSGMPSMVDFGRHGCRPCDMMAPILKTLKGKYKGRANILFVHVEEEQILASRYGVSSIPCQVFFNKTGREVYRHTGFLAQEKIEKRLAGLGAK